MKFLAEMYSTFVMRWHSPTITITIPGPLIIFLLLKLMEAFRPTSCHMAHAE